MTADRDFLFWLHERLIHKYGENENTDFVQKLHAIAQVTPPKVDTWIQERRGRYAVLGETSTVGPRWLIWDNIDKKEVITGFEDQTVANRTVGLLNLYAQEKERREKAEPCAS